MTLTEAYKTFQERIEKEPEYQTIVDSDLNVYASVLYLLKAYREYILCVDSLNKPVGVTKLSNILPKEECYIGNLLEACAILSDSLALDYERILSSTNKPLTDPYDLVDIMLTDCLQDTMVDDEPYLDVIASIYSLLSVGNFDTILKSLFLKFSYTKRWK